MGVWVWEEFIFFILIVGKVEVDFVWLFIMKGLFKILFVGYGNIFIF